MTPQVPTPPRGAGARRAHLSPLLVALALTIAACGATSPAPTGTAHSGAGPARISGTITGIGAFGSAAAEGHTLVAASVQGEVIVTLDGTGAPPASLEHGGRTLRLVRPLALPGTALYADAGPATTGDRLGAHRAQPAIVHAEANVRLHPMATTPTEDPLYTQQWALRASRTPAAWNVTRGDPGVVVAILDSGVLADPARPERTHPDLAGRVLPGFDFISDPTMGNDGDGRDPDPYDSGSSTGPNPAWHGTHVAGIVGAATRDGAGMSGVAGDTRLLPVRVTGVGGGTLADLTDAIVWSAGLPVPGLPTNPNPAKVLNLSLGATTGCPAALARAIAAAERTGAITVAAAGNAGTHAGSVAPANCPGVIAVAASGPRDERASYSNYGGPVTITAPGGDFTYGSNGGVISLWRDGRDGPFTHARLQGTSMAAPHVAGAAALMLATNPALTPANLRTLLAATSTPLTAQACRRTLASDCGAGLLNVERAVLAANGTATLAITARAVLTGDARRVVAPLVSSGWRYSLTDLEPGAYDLSAFLDYDGDGELDGDEPHTLQTLRVHVEAGVHLSNADLALSTPTTD